MKGLTVATIVWVPKEKTAIIVYVKGFESIAEIAKKWVEDQGWKAKMMTLEEFKQSKYWKEGS